MRTAFCLLIILFSFTQVHAQQLNGKVFILDKNGKKANATNAYVKLGTPGKVVACDKEGNFSLNATSDTSQFIYAYSKGFDVDSLQVETGKTTYNFLLRQDMELDEVSITARYFDTEIGLMKPIKVETIGQGELKKAACCNLAESFESNASVDVVYSDAVSGARTIQMLGLSGIYTQMLTENIPLTRGLSANYGMSFIPGTWVESIQVTKGVGSVVNGYESMTGAINVEFIKPEKDKTEKFFVNLYGNLMGRAEANVHLGKKFNDKVSTLLFLHSNSNFLENDYNKDGFLDNPLNKQINIFNRWKIQGKKTEQVIGFRMLLDDKTGGQTQAHKDEMTVNENHYGVGIDTRLYEAFIKNGFLFPKSKFASLGIIASGKRHEHDSYFGNRKYKATQNSGYLNMIYQNILFNSFHQIKAGASMVYDDFNQSYNDSTFRKEERVPGAFVEYTGNPEGKFTFMAGMRADYHNMFGMKLTPRAHLKYNLKETSSIRLLAGTGFRTANVLMENAATLASSRNVIVATNLNPEETFNTGASITQRFLIRDRESSFNVDYYYTSFINQVVVDFDSDVHELRFYNLDGASYSHSVQADLDMQVLKQLNIKAAYKHYIVKTTYGGTLLDKPFVPRQRAMLNLSFQTTDKKWKIDLINNWFGLSRIPSTNENPEAYRMPEKSTQYFIMHAQVTKLFRKFEVYAGAENLLGFTQKFAIIGANDPFGSYFDASMIWGPMNGRNIYFGLRYGIK